MNCGVEAKCYESDENKWGGGDMLYEGANFINHLEDRSFIKDIKHINEFSPFLLKTTLLRTNKHPFLNQWRVHRLFFHLH